MAGLIARMQLVLVQWNLKGNETFNGPSQGTAQTVVSRSLPEGHVVWPRQGWGSGCDFVFHTLLCFFYNTSSLQLP